MVLRSNETSETWRYLFCTILQNESWKFYQNLTLVTFGSERVKLNSGEKSVCGWEAWNMALLVISIEKSERYGQLDFDYEDKGDGMSLFGNSCLETEECFYSLEKESSN